ncbi:MAG: acetyl-CoA carboxylase, biotin carboxyl carrier protein [Deltaproteobacteria bacterium RIFCSPLOWO2_12_FULL_60_19]|nr:MAG: acetyl-CoA carboxylase, biotin carboxyl carrier protein [Deltaproteobacteria bacterium RIFCSPLOWO2_12_FULL_60_19]
MELTQEEVLQILQLIEKSDFDFMQLQVGELKLTVSKGNYVPGVAAAPAVASDPQPVAKPVTELKTAKPKAEPAAAKPKQPATADGVVIVAPMVGTFYTTPEPGAPPFVDLGAKVDEETTVGLIEVMKVFNAVQSRARGVIAEVCVQNGQFVEYGQTLFIVRPDGGSAAKRSSQ